MASTAASPSPFQQIPFRYGWVAAVVILLSLIILTGIYILIREPPVVTTTVDTGTAELPADVMQRARQLEALNRSLAEEVAAGEAPLPGLPVQSAARASLVHGRYAVPLGRTQPQEVPADQSGLWASFPRRFP